LYVQVDVNSMKGACDSLIEMPRKCIATSVIVAYVGLRSCEAVNSVMVA
jgi:hypothetical protein